MEPNVWVVAVTAIIVAVFALIFSSLSYKRLDRIEDDSELFEFKPSPWALSLALFSCSVSFAFFWIAYSYQPADFSSPVWVWIIFGGAGLGWFTLCLFWFLKVKSSYCNITKHGVDLKYGRRSKSIEFSSVDKIEQVGFHIWILASDRKLKLKIPMIFSCSHDMLGLLRKRHARRNWETRGGHSVNRK